MTRQGYLLEHKFSNMMIIDETDRDAEFPVHRRCIGPLKIWREDTIPTDSGKDKKLTYYKLSEMDPMNQKNKLDFYTAILTDIDQNLSNLSIETIKKEADPNSQKIISQMILWLSITFNIFMVIQESLNPDEQFIINITLANAGWLLFAFAMLKILDLRQQRPAVFGGLFVLYWGSVFNPSENELVNVAFSTPILTDKIRISDALPLKVEIDQILLHSNNRKKAEDKYEAEYQERMNLTRTVKDLKITLALNEKRTEAIAKENYKNGLEDGAHSITVRTKSKDFVANYPSITWPAVILVASILLYFLLRNLSVAFPEAIFIVELAEFPWQFWLIAGFIVFFVGRWIFQTFGVIR